MTNHGFADLLLFMSGIAFGFFWREFTDRWTNFLEDYYKFHQSDKTAKKWFEDKKDGEVLE